MNKYDTFVALVELKSFSAVAKKFHRTPSAISKKINLLEQNLNVQLLNRTTRSLSVTEAGQIFYERCKDISQRMNDAENELKEVSGEPSGVINITWPDILSNSKAVDILSAFSRKYPEIKVRVKISPDILSLTEGNIDFAFRVAPPVDSSMIAAELFRIEPLVCVAPEIIERFGMPKTIEDLADIPHVFESHINLPQKARQQFPNLKLDSNDHHQVSNITGLHHMAIRGMGAAVLFRHSVERELEEGSLIDLTANNKLEPLSVYLMYHRLNFYPKKIRCFIDFFKSQLRD